MRKTFLIVLVFLFALQINAQTKKDFEGFVKQIDVITRFDTTNVTYFTFSSSIVTVNQKPKTENINIISIFDEKENFINMVVSWNGATKEDIMFYLYRCNGMVKMEKNNLWAGEFLNHSVIVTLGFNWQTSSWLANFTFI